VAHVSHSPLPAPPRRRTISISGGMVGVEAGAYISEIMVAPMAKSPSADELVAKIQTAFRPFRCVAEVWDYDQKIRFRIFDADDQTLLTMPSLVLRELVDNPDQLDALIDMVRLRLQSQQDQ
jgi:hypothetical protein